MHYISKANHWNQLKFELLAALYMFESKVLWWIADKRAAYCLNHIWELSTAKSPSPVVYFSDAHASGSGALGCIVQRSDDLNAGNAALGSNLEEDCQFSI